MDSASLLQSRTDAASVNRLAIPALVFGLVGLVFPIVVPSIVGIVLGAAALVRLRRLRRGDPAIPGGLAIAALVISICTFIVNLAAIALVFTVLPRLVWLLFGGSWDSPPSG